MKKTINVFWFRRDLRLKDNAALFHALQEETELLCIFIYDKAILNRLEDTRDRRVDFISRCVDQLNKTLVSVGSSLTVFNGLPAETFNDLSENFTIGTVFANHDYEPYAIERDQQISDLLSARNISFKTFKDQCIFEKDEILKSDGRPYTVFTPYSRCWLQKLSEQHYKDFKTEKFFKNFYKCKPKKLPSLSEIGFEKTDLSEQEVTVSPEIPLNYKTDRNFPAVKGTSRLSHHLRFGTVSIRSLVQLAINTKNEAWLNELIWRDFYMMILWQFPHVVNSPFKEKYSRMIWRNNEKEFSAWCEGRTGFPIVDAGMRELLATGFMHNRVRMIVSSFLVKDLLIDWRWGEAWFAAKLLDYDLSANNGGWQWAAGTGCDAAPYFRIFNPGEQQKKFDPEFRYIKKWIPEFGSPKYPLPIVDHAQARIRALATYKNISVSEI